MENGNGSNDSITLVSTSDSAEQVAEALGAAPAAKEPAAADPAAATPAATDPAAATPAAKEPAAADPNAADPTVVPENETAEQKTAREARAGKVEKRINKIQGQIDELTTKKHTVRRDVEAEEARLATLRAEIAALQGGADPARVPATPAADPVRQPAADATAFDKPRPKLDDTNADGQPVYANYEAWVEAIGDWSAEKAAAASRAEIAAMRKADSARIERESASRAEQEHLATYQSKLEEFKQSTPDFDAVYAAAAEDVTEIIEELGPHAIDVIDLYTTRDADNGPAIVHHLMTNPDEMRRIAGLPVPMQLAALGKLDARLDGAKTSTGPSSKVAPTTKAPEPIKPVGSSPTATVTPDPEKESYAEYRDRRNREELAGARR